MTQLLFKNSINFQEFLNDYNNFTIKIGDFDRRLATIICQAFDDCSGVESLFKVCID